MKVKNSFIALIILLVVSLTAGCSFFTALNTVVDQENPISTVAPVTEISAPVTTTTSDLNSAIAAYEGTLEDIYTEVSPSVVNIDVEIVSTVSNQFGPNNPFSDDSTQTEQALGSGFIWDTEGHIITNNHVVESATSITVTFSDGTSASAELVGSDSESDLAVIKVDVDPSLLHPVTLADSSQVKVGQMAIAIGNPYGLSGTMTEGIISALSRSLSVDETSTTGSYTIPDIIQTDAAINPGNSGGVLLNAQGQVIGVTAAIQSSSESNSGIGFVIPSNIVKKVVPALIETGSYLHPRLGISGTELTYDINEELGLEPNQQGVLVIEIVSGGPADEADIQGTTTSMDRNGNTTYIGGDIIIAIDGQTVETFEDLTSYLFYNTEVGQTVNLTILRDGEEISVDVIVNTID